MNLYTNQDLLLRRYLLDDLTPEEQQLVENWLLGEADGGSGTRAEDELDYVDRLLLAEDELIDDYARSALAPRERELFERRMLLTAERREKLIIAQELVQHAAASSEPEMKAAPAIEEINGVRMDEQAIRTGQSAEPHLPNEWWRSLFVPSWKIVVYALLLLGIGLGIWWPRQGEIEKGLAALNRAYRTARPLEARISGLPYARFTTTKGSERDTPDYRPRELAERILLDEADKPDAGPAAQHALGKLYLAKKEFAKAITHFETALQTAPGNAQLRSDYGVALLERGKSERLDAQSGKGEITLAQSLEQFNKALELDGALLEALFNRALLYQALGLNHHARTDWQKYLERDSASPWAAEAQENLKLLGEDGKRVSQSNEQLYQSFIQAYQAGDSERALQSFSLSYNYSGNLIVWRLVESFLVPPRGAEEPGAQLQKLTYIGNLVRERTGDLLTADLARYYVQARPDQLPLLATGRRLMREGFELYRAAQNEEAIARYTQAKRLFAQTGNTSEALLAEALIGHSHHLRSDPHNSRAIFSRLAPLCAEKKYYWLQVHALCGLANAHDAANEFSQAIAAGAQAYQLAERIGDVGGTVRCLALLGNYYYSLGKHEDNLRLSARGRAICAQLPPDPARTSGFYLLPALSLIALGLCEVALNYQNEVLQMAEGTKAPRLFGRLYVQRGRSYAGLNQYEPAIENMQRGIAIGQQLQADKTGREFMAYGLLSLGYVYHAAGKQAEALHAFNQVIDFHQRDDKQSFLYQAYKGRLMTRLAQGGDVARAEVDEVIALFERYRKQIREESNRNSFYHKEQSVYDLAIDFAQARQGNPEQAIDYLELSRARSLLDASRRARETITGPDLPELLFIETAAPVAIADLLPQLPPEIQLLEYAVLEDKLLIWLITKDAPIASRVVNVSRNDLTNRVNHYLALIAQPPAPAAADWRAQGRELYELLIQPFAAQLDEHRQLCIAPDKVLTRLPFGALVVDEAGRFLVEKHRLSYAASANMFLFSTEMARQKAGQTAEGLCAVGNPRFNRRAFPELDDLRWAAEEATRVARFYDAPVVLTGAQATKNEVLKELRRADVVHLAMHYVPSERSPLLSQLPLAAAPAGATSSGDADGLLRVHEIYRLGKLQPRLIVLSACQTTAEGFLSGEGALGVSRPFQAAGIPLVVASLWRVEEKASMQLMIEFHRQRRLARQPTVAALRESQRDLLRNGSQYRHPYYWAAFITVGGYSAY